MQVVTSETGKPIRQALAELRQCVAHIDAFAQHAEELELEQKVFETPNKREIVRWGPRGVIADISTW